MTSDASAASRRSFRWGTIAIAVVVIGAIIFIALNVLRDAAPERLDTSAGKSFSCTVLGVDDGDGPINCAELDLLGKPISVRLRGIDAREIDNSCQHAELCPKASGAEAKAVLTSLAKGRLQCVSYGPSYSRVDARCETAAGLNLSCELIKRGTAVRWPEYDREGRLIACVPRQR